MLYNVIGYNNQILGQIEATNQIEAWEGAGRCNGRKKGTF